MSSNSNANNVSFQRNTASIGGGAIVDGNRNSITNSEFISNFARYGGGGVVEQGTNTIIDHCIIYNNTATTYGGGVNINTGTITNSIVENNNAIFGAGVYTLEGIINNVTFIHNNGTLGQDISVVDETSIINSNYDYIYYHNLTQQVSVSPAQSDVDGYLKVENGDYGFCIEYGTAAPDNGYVDSSLNLVVNSETGGNVGEYIKLLIYNNVNSEVISDNFANSLCLDVWNLTRTDFRNNPNISDRLRDVLRRYDAGERIPTTNAVKEVGGSYLIFNFYSIVTSTVHQNVFAYNVKTLSNINPNLEVRKITLNKTVNVGEKTYFTIVVTNTGDVGLTNVFVREESYEGLTYSGFTGENWVQTGNVFKYTNALEIGESVYFTVEFNTTEVGNFTNTVVAGAKETEDKTSENTTEVINNESVLQPGMEVTKKSLTPSVLVGDQTLFLITVSNTGEVDLGNVFVTEEFPAGLTFADYSDKSVWSRDGNTFWYNGVLVPGASASFTIVFNTSVNGTFVNCVVAGSNGTENKTSSNSTTVKKQGMEVTKKSLTPNVLVGDQTLFLITVSNTGEVALDNVFVREDLDNGLIYDSYYEESEWIKDGNIFYYNGVLVPGASASFTIVFNTSVNGTFVNCVVAGYNETEEDTAENQTNVLKPKLDVQKITLTPIVHVGDLATFEIVVKNIGEIRLYNVFIEETSYAGLIYNSFARNDEWIYSFDNGKHRWTLNRALCPNAEAMLIVRFDTVEVGEFTNIVTAGSDNTTDVLAENTTIVYNETTPVPLSNSSQNPNLTVEKVALEKVLVVNENAEFQIIVHNTGNVALSGVTVFEESFDGLTYNSFRDYTGLWIKNNDLSWTFNDTLYSGEYVSFYVIFDANRTGEFTNIVSANSNETPKTYANDSVIVVSVTPGEPIIEEPETPEESVPVEPVVPVTPEESVPVEPVVPVTPEESVPVEPQDQPLLETTEVVENKTTETPQNSTASESPKENNNKDILPATGNPLIMVLLALIALGAACIRRKE